jgi:glutathione peroxidase
MLRLLIIPFLFMIHTSVSVYDFKVAALTGGGTIDLSAYKGKKILIVNTASKCGFTPQYADLEKLYEKYKDKLVIIGFPANNFHEQEPGTNSEISEFCKKNYGVTFPMAAKVDVIGDSTAPLFKIKWNFTKFLIDENGKLIAVYNSKVTPMSDEITSHLN